MTNQDRVILVQAPSPQSSASATPLPVVVTNTPVNITGWAAVVISLFTAFILLRSARLQFSIARLQFESEKLKLIDELTSDYYYILYELKHKVDKDSFSAEDYYRRYWSQLLREFDSWCNGVVDDERYSRWLRQEKLQYDDNKLIGNLSYQDAYNQKIKSSFPKVVGDKFFELIDALFESNGHDNAENVVRDHRDLKNNRFSSPL